MSDVIASRLTVRAGERDLWLCFEPWATEHVVAAGTAVVVEFAGARSVLEMEHHREGITFLSNGLHPDIRGEDGSDVLILSDVMPPTPDVSDETLRDVMSVLPPARPATGVSGVRDAHHCRRDRRPAG
ncbi:hypothetical protein [Streptomyces roseoverticillatus]|uniref:hypothetical protein n=1 Tax=Streptomyces roseoverticillatus TaxID=66429 RepID=UPI0004C25F31|nr:hypothetical protein [Streptomyces roseoverticillatus]